MSHVSKPPKGRVKVRGLGPLYIYVCIVFEWQERLLIQCCHLAVCNSFSLKGTNRQYRSQMNQYFQI